MNLVLISLFSFVYLRCSAGPLEDLSAMPDLTLFYQQLLRLPDLQRILQDVAQSQQAGITGDFTIFAPSNDAMSRLSQRNEDPNLLWKYHIAPGRYDDLTIYKLAQEKYTLANPRQMANDRPQNNLPTLAPPFQLFYGSGFFAGIGPYINVSYDNNNYGNNILPWAMQTTLNQTNRFDNSIPLNPHMANLNNYNPNQNSQSYVVAQGSASSGNPNLFPQNLTNYYTNVFNPNVNTQFLQNAYPPSSNLNPTYQQQQMVNQLPYNNVGVPRPTINNAIVLQTRLMSRGVINVIDNILWPPERRDQASYKTAYDALEDAQFSRLRLLAQRSEYFRSELTSLNHQTFFLPNDQAFASFGSGLSFLFDQTTSENTNDINDFIRSHIIPIVMFPTSMDAAKQISTLSQGKWVTFRKLAPVNPAVSVDVVSNRQAARVLTTRSEDVRFFGNGVVYTIPVILSGPTRSAADELAQSFQYFMSLVQQSGDTELVNILQGSTAGLGNTGPNIFNPQNLLNITVLIPQQISVKQLGNSQELSRNLRRHIIRFPVYTDQSMMIQQQLPFAQPGYGVPAFQRSASGGNTNFQRRQRRRRRQINMPLPNQNLPPQQQQLPVLPFQQPPIQSPEQILPYQQQQQQQQQILPFQQQQLNPALNPGYYQLPNYPTSAIFQDGQFYPTMDPEFSIQAQVTMGSTGSVVTLIGRPDDSQPFTAAILNTESNIPVKNGVMHVIRGILSGSAIPIDNVLSTMQGASSFTQLLQQTGVVEQLKQSGRTYTLFIPTNAALQSIGVSTDMNRIRQFVLRHVCADVLLDPMANIIRTQGSYFRRQPMSPVPPQMQQRRSRRKRQAWADTWRNITITSGGQYMKAPDLGPGYFQPNQQVYGGYPAAPSPFSSYNQLYNPGYVMSGYANPNSQYYPGYNGTYLGDSFNYQGLGVPGQDPNAAYYSPQISVIPITSIESPNYLIGMGGFFSGSNYIATPQSCMSMTGERITVQPLAGAQPGGINQPMYYQNFMTTCCGDQSVNAMVQSFNVYPPSYAVYVVGSPLLSRGQTINTMYNQTSHLHPESSILFIFYLLFLIIKNSF